MHSVPVPINVRCYSNSDTIVRRSEVTLRAKTGLMQCSIYADKTPDSAGGFDI